MTATRKSVTPRPEDLAFLQRVRQPGTPEAEAFEELTHISNVRTDSEALGALIHIGRCAVEYEQLRTACEKAAIADREDPDRRAWRDAMHGRRMRLRPEAGA
jgi:hypothetical protein